MGIASRTVRLQSAVVIGMLVLWWPCVAVAAPPSVSSSELVERAAEWDGERVTFRGEAVGSAMRRGDRTWLHLNDDAYADLAPDSTDRAKGYNSGHAVLVPSELAEQVRHFGAYGVRGDLVSIEGTFRAADTEYGGDMLIAADSLQVERVGGRMKPGAAMWKLPWLGALLATTGLAYAALRWRRRHTLIGAGRPGTATGRRHR